MSSLAAILAKPVVRAHLRLAHAHAAIAATVARGMRAGTVRGNGTLEERIRIEAHILELNIRNLEARREQVAGALARVLRPLISIQAPRNRLLAEAHNVNADRGFPLSEDEVEEIAKAEVWQAMQRARRYG